MRLWQFRNAKKRFRCEIEVFDTNASGPQERWVDASGPQERWVEKSFSYQLLDR